MSSCRWCNATFEDEAALEKNEQIHRDLDFLNGIAHTEDKSDSSEETADQDDDGQTRDKNEGLEHTLFVCQNCGKNFSRSDALIRHTKSCSSKDHGSSPCTKCAKSFSSERYKTLHQKTCQSTEHVCLKCQKRCSTYNGLRRHLQWHDKQPLKRNKTMASATKTTENETLQHAITPQKSQYRCRRCPESFVNRHELYIHGMREHYNQVGGALQQRPWNENNAPWLRQGEDDGLRVVYEANSPLILETHRRGPIQSVYNFPLDNDVNLNQLMGYANEIFNREQRAFRLNIVFGTILQNRETRQYRYFVPYNNNGIFERPFYFSKRSDLNHLRNRLRHMDIITELLRNRPDTKWFPVLVTNVHFTVYSTNYPLGRGNLPNYLIKMRSIYPLVINRQNGESYDDNLCVFRCLALHIGHDIKAVERHAKLLYNQWSREPIQAFDGVSFEQFPEFETRFQVNMEVYSLQEDGFARSVYKSRGLYDSTMYVNLFGNHLSYIKNFGKYAKKFQCKTCDRHFQHSRDLDRHQRVCTNQTKYVFPGGFHKAQESIFDRLSEFDIDVPEQERTFPWFVCYDFESLLEKINDQTTQFLEWTHKHVPISLSICSNVEGYHEPICIVEPDQDRLVQRMVSTMDQIANRVNELAEQKFGLGAAGYR